MYLGVRGISGMVERRHAQKPPARGRANEHGEQAFGADDACQVLHNVVKRMALIGEQTLALLGIQPVSAIWLRAEGLLRQHPDAHHLQHAPEIVPVEHLTGGTAADEQNLAPDLVSAYSLRDCQAGIIGMNNLEARLERNAEHDRVWTAQTQRGDVRKTKDRPRQP